MNIEIADDGAGIDLERVRQRAVENGALRPDELAKLNEHEVLNLIFLPGFSTVPTVSRISGRGVGMDVVKACLEKIGGAVDLSTQRGLGSTVRLKIPLTLAIIPGLVVTSGGERFIIPQANLLRLIHLEPSSKKRIEYVVGAPVYRRHGRLLPVVYLNQILGLKSAKPAREVNLLVLQADDKQFGLVVDDINDTQEIVVKPLTKQVKHLSIYAGATILGDGRVALILDIPGFARHSRALADTHTREERSSATAPAQTATKQQHLLLLRAGSFARVAIPLTLVTRIEEIPRSSIERAAGSRVVQYRNSVLPLVSLRSVLKLETPQEREFPDPAQVIVCRKAERSIGLVVDQVLDVLEAAASVDHKPACRGVLGSGIVAGQVTDFLDLDYVINASSYYRPSLGCTANPEALSDEAPGFSAAALASPSPEMETMLVDASGGG